MIFFWGGVKAWEQNSNNTCSSSFFLLMTHMKGFAQRTGCTHRPERCEHYRTEAMLVSSHPACEEAHLQLCMNSDSVSFMSLFSLQSGGDHNKLPIDDMSWQEREPHKDEGAFFCADLCTQDVNLCALKANVCGQNASLWAQNANLCPQDSNLCWQDANLCAQNTNFCAIITTINHKLTYLYL